MTPQMYVTIGISLLNLAFFAGGAWVIVKTMRKDVNGLGKSFRDRVKADDRRHRVIVVALIKGAPDAEAKDRAAELLLEE